MAGQMVQTKMTGAAVRKILPKFIAGYHFPALIS